MCDEINWQEFFHRAIISAASDIHLTVGQRPYMRCLGALQPLACCPLTESVLSEICAFIMSEYQREKLTREREIDMSWNYDGRRFRVHAYYQQGWPALACRLLPERIPSLAELNAPKAWQKIKETDQGLILVTGRTGSGKSTTLAAFIAELNREKACHIVTLEDPIEYVFKPDKCFISQREWGRDFYSFPQALRGALREMPDVILVGEIRDRETLETALTAAAAGMLVLGTLHSRSAAETILRMEGMFPSNERESARALIAQVLTGIISQTLLPAADGGRTALYEVLLSVPAVTSLIRQGKYSQLSAVMMSHLQQGMQTRSQALQDLWQNGRISRETWERQQGESYEL